MPRHQSSIASLQQALSMELTAVQQYLLHAHVLDDWGLDKLAAKMREEMQEELGHAGQFIDRILYLGGTPEVVPAKAPVKAESLKGMFEKRPRRRGGGDRVLHLRRPRDRGRPAISAAG